MARIDDLISERIERIENIPDRFINKVAASQDELFAELILILEQLGLSRGSLQLNAQNLALVDRLMEQYYQVLRQSRYGRLVAGFIAELEKQKSLNDEIFNVEFDLSPGSQSAAVFQSSRQTALRQLIGDDFKTNFINVVRDQVIQSVEAKASFKQLRDDLFGLFNDTEQRQGTIHNWVSQISRDIFSVTDRSYNNAVAEELELEFGVYAGGLVRDSRPFCTSRAGNYYHINEVRSWANLTDWKGRYRRTTESNIIHWLGGYNCMHVFSFRSVRNVPPEVIQRNIANANYRPSLRERELLGI